MTKFFALEPEVGGDWGPNTILSNEAQFLSGEATIPEITHLEYLFDVWLGDPILQGEACYIVTKSLAEAMVNVSISGSNFTSVEITASEVWEQLKPDEKLPPFYRLIPAGVAHIQEGDLLIYWSGHDVCWGQRIDYVPPTDVEEVVELDMTRLPYSLVVTEKCLAVMQQHHLVHCKIMELRQAI